MCGLAGFCSSCVSLPSQKHTFLTQRQHNDTSNLRTLLRLHVFENIPIDSSITYTDLASKIGGQDVFRLQRVIHYAILNGLFFEPQPGHVAHSSLSATIVNDAGHTALIRHCVEEVYPSSSREADWMLQHPVNDGEPTETGFRLAFGTEKKFFEYIYEEPDRRQNFAMAMTSLTAPGAILDGANVLRLFDWAKLGRATIVDVSLLPYERFSFPPLLVLLTSSHSF